MTKNNFIINFLFLIISLLLAVYFVGKNNFWFNQTDWLYGSGDLTNAQLSWQFFKNDIWRFPIGLNPNYGLEISNSIIFTDNIPLFAIIFKFLNPIIYENFQYFSVWIFICFFLQLFISYKLVLSITKNNALAIISSFLFLSCPFLIFRLSHHFSLGAQWLILYSFYVAYFIPESKKKDFHWYLLIFLSLMTHLYFTVMVFTIYSFYVFEKILINKKFGKEIINLFYKIIFSLILMFALGYFESHLINAVSSGYGVFKIDILSFFDPQLNNKKTWSFFLNDIPGTHLEGFSYIGFGNIILFIIAIIVFFISGNKKNINNIDFKILRPLNIYLLIFFLWSLTTNVSFMGNEFISLDLPKYIFAALSIFSSTGRFSWPVIYFFIFISIFVVYKNFPKKYSTIIILIIVIIQLLDISVGINNYKFKKDYKKIFKQQDPIWDIIQKDFEIIRTTYLFNNYGPIFSGLSKILSNKKNIKTDIILNASMDRVKAAQVRYDLIENINNNSLIMNTAYIVDNLGHLKQLKKQFSNQNYGFFFRDKFWIVLPKKKNLMNKNDKSKLKNIEIKKIKLNKKYYLKFKGDFLGFGWSHNFDKKGAWSEGHNSFLLLKKPSLKRNLEIEFSFLPYKKNTNKDYKFKIFINEKYIETINLQKNNNAKINLANTTEDEILIRFEFDNIISPYDILESPDARRLGILLKSFTIREKI